uniref:Reverse transcriptase domain-containing protein n=1 Tax=Trichobilharzia regenti TaxID=157069 RepID=A0AA85KJ67_TRIRE|nr:unnamed protein product [Trichobilharzia regenti]
MKAQVEENKALEGTSKTQELCKILQKRLKKGEENNISHLEHEGINYDDPQIISELLSEWFSNNTKAHPSPILDITCKNNYKLGEINFNIQNIASAVRTLKANSSCGIDDIPSVIYKNGGTDMIVLLLRIFNISLVTETYPETWKNTYILPKHKGGAKTSACNYRPINITPVISRIMEKVIEDQMSDYFLKHKLDLGLIYSQNLSFSEHISNQVSKSRRLIGFLLRNLYRNESRILLYKFCVRPLLDYCSFIFSSTRIEDKLKVEGVQRYFTRKVLGTDNGTNYSTRCEILGLETLWLRRLRLNLSLFYKLLNQIVHTPANYTRSSGNTGYNLRHTKGTVAIEPCKTATRQRFFLVRYAQIWNKLPEKTRLASTLASFEKALNDTLSEFVIDTSGNSHVRVSEIIGPFNV